MMRFPEFVVSRNMKVVRGSALPTGRIYPPGDKPGTHFCYRLSRPQGHSAAGRIKSMKSPNFSIEYRTRDLPACSAVPQSTALPQLLAGEGQHTLREACSSVICSIHVDCPRAEESPLG
jgi:hypothetical protein